MVDIKSELTTKINDIKESNDLKINKCISQLNKVNEDANQEIFDTRGVSDDLAQMVKNIEEYIKDKFHEAISVAIQNKLEDTDLEFIKDMIKKHIVSKIEDKLDDNITNMIEEKFQNIKDINEVMFQDMRAELIGAHAIKNGKDREMNDNINQRIDTMHAPSKYQCYRLTLLAEST